MSLRGLSTAVVLMSAALLSGCVIGRGHVNQPIDEQKIDSIERGVTTKKEILQRFGPPAELEPRELVAFGIPQSELPIDRPLGIHFFRYRYTRVNAFAVITLVFNYFDGDLKSDNLLIFFDENDVVEDFAFARNTDLLPRFGPLSR